MEKARIKFAVVTKGSDACCASIDNVTCARSLFVPFGGFSKRCNKMQVSVLANDLEYSMTCEK